MGLLLKNVVTQEKEVEQEGSVDAMRVADDITQTQLSDKPIIEAIT